MVGFEVMDVFDEVFALVFGGNKFSSIHSDGIAGAGLDAIAAINATQKIDGKGLRVFFFFGNVSLGGFDVDAIGGANRLAEHASGTADATVLAKHQAMFRAMDCVDHLFLFGVRNRYHSARLQDVFD